MKKFASVFMALILVFTLATMMSVTVFAEEAEPATAEAAQAEAAADEASVTSTKALAAALAVGVVGTAGAIGMAMAICKSAESMARQPEAASKINSAMMLGLVFIETAIIYALIIAILVIFVL